MPQRKHVRLVSPPIIKGDNERSQSRERRPRVLSRLSFVSQVSRSKRLLLNRPPRDRRVNLFHQPNRFFERDDDARVMRLVLRAQFAPAPILEPFVTHLIPANLKFPHVLRHALKSLLIVDPHSFLFVLGITRCDDAITLADKFRDEIFERGRFHQMKRDELRAERGQRAKQFHVARKRDARKIYLEKFRIAFPIRG